MGRSGSARSPRRGGASVRGIRTVDVDELKANRRDLLRAVRGGETLRVVHEGEVVAEVVGPREEVAETPPADLEARLQALAAAGQIQRAHVPRDGWIWAPRGIGMDPATVQQILDDVRADRLLTADRRPADAVTAAGA